MSNDEKLAELKKQIAENPPRAYDLTNIVDVQRLIRETRGYLHTCRREHHGTDWEGRRFAVEAFETLAKGDWKIVLHPPE